MKTIQVDAIITGIRSKVDRSLGLSVSTPELSTNEKALFMELQGINTRMTIEPLDDKAEGIEKIETVKMLTQDGQLVEVDAKLLAASRKKISDKELQDWVKNRN